MAAMGWWEKSRIHQALKRLIAGPGIEVDSTTPSAPVVSAKISTDPSNALSFGTDDGLFATGGGGGSVPTGTGFTHITSGVQDAAAKAVDLATADVTGDLPYANLEPATAASRILVRGSAGGAGDWQEGTLGTGLSISGTVLSAAAVPTDGSIVVGLGGLGASKAVLVPQVIYLVVPADYALTGWEVFADPAATLSVDVWYSTFPTLPVVGDSIVATNYITTTAGSSNTGATGSWGTTAVTRGNFLAISLTANDLATYVVVQLQGDKS